MTNLNMQVRLDALHFMDVLVSCWWEAEWQSGLKTCFLFQRFAGEERSACVRRAVHVLHREW